jgi:hypothetical protein
MATIKVRRGSEWVGRLRAYRVLLDGTDIGHIRRNEEQTFPLPAGNHELQIKVDWCSSEPLRFSIAEAETATFECGSNAGPFSALYFVIFRPKTFFWVRRTA